MKKSEVRNRITEYLDNNHIDYTFLYEDNKPVSIDEADTIYIVTKMDSVIGHYLETSLRLKDDSAYLQTYYCQKVIHNEEQAIRAARILNYINMYHNYDCYNLYEHVFVLDEISGDIFVGTNIRYELLEKYWDESINHILNYGIKMMTDICTPVLLYSYGKFDYEQAKKLIDETH